MMATSGGERYIRSVLLVARGSRLVLKQIILCEVEYTKRTLSEILSSNKDQLSKVLTGSQYNRIFSSIEQVNTDLDTWEIQLLCLVIETVFEENLSAKAIDDIKLIRKRRSDIKLHSAYYSMTEEEYKAYRNDLSEVFIRLAPPAIQDRCKDLLHTALSGSLDILSVVFDLREFETQLPPLKEISACATVSVEGWLNRSLERQAAGSDISSGIEDDAETSLDTNEDTSEDHLTEKVIEFIREIKGSNVPETVNERDIRARLKQLHAKQGNSMLELMEIIIDLVKRKEKQDERSEDSPNTSGITAITSMDENQQIKKEIKSDDYEEFAYQRGVFAVTPSHENQRIKEGIIASSKYRAVEDNDKEFALQTGASKQNIVTELNQEYFDCPGEEEWMSFLNSGNKKVAKRLVKLGRLPKQRILDEICLLFGRKSKVTLMICKAICAHIKSKDKHIINVWAAYTLQNTNSITFVVSLEELEEMEKKDQDEIIRLDKMIDYSYIKRRLGEYSYESTEIINHNVTSDEDFDDDAYGKLQICVAKYSVELMKDHKYLSVVSACSKRSTGYGSSSWNLKPENCIVLYVHTKHYIPINEDPFKRHYDGIPVDVREGAFIPFGRAATDLLDNVQMGCQIRGEVRNGKYVEGTLGCFIDHPQYGVCGLTCAHVLLSPWDLIRLKLVHNGTFNWPLHDMQRTVYQPANQTNEIGHTVQLIYNEGSESCTGMEVALFKLTNRHPKSSDFPDASVTVSTTTRQINYKHWRICSADRLNSRMKQVVKFGSKTELRDGIIEFGTVSAKELHFYPRVAGYSGIKLHKQIEVKPQTPGLLFADNGDSGALVFLAGDNNSEHTCIGIVEGGTTYGTVVVTPILPILEELKVSSLKSFDSENTLSEIHGKIENVGSEVQTVKNNVQTLTGEMQRMRSDMQNIDSRMDNGFQQIQQMLSVVLPSHNTHQSPAPPNT